MKVISLHVAEDSYQELKSLAKSRGRPVADLVREAMTEYVAREQRSAGSVLDLKPHASGGLLKTWSRSELLDEMVER